MTETANLHPNQLKPWGEIHRDYKTRDEAGKRWVMYSDKGGLTLGPWYGPKGPKA